MGEVVKDEIFNTSCNFIINNQYDAALSSLIYYLLQDK